MDKDRILQSLSVLKKHDKKLTIFGASGHRYALNPPLSPEQVDGFESGHGVVLPDDYKLFICEIGNGGAGPYHGVFPFGFHDDGDSLCGWAEGGLVGDPAKPFPHDAAWNLPESFWDQEPNPPEGTPEEELDKLYEEWDARLQRDYWNPGIMDGAIPICHVGCALRVWLVINGARKGELWADDRADNGGVHPLQGKTGGSVTFGGWYCDWLEDALGQFGVTTPVSGIRPGWWARIWGGRR